MVELRKIDRENWRDVIKLTVAESQKNFVAPNVYSIAQSKAQPECIPMAVYSDDVPVGFVMYCMDADDNEYWIYRLMIDEQHQGKGLGRQAMNLVLAEIGKDTSRHKVYISFEPDNDAARKLYESLGFGPDGRILDGEIVYCLSPGRKRLGRGRNPVSAAGDGAGFAAGDRAGFAGGDGAGFAGGYGAPPLLIIYSDTTITTGVHEMRVANG